MRKMHHIHFFHPNHSEFWAGKMSHSRRHRRRLARRHDYVRRANMLMCDRSETQARAVWQAFIYRACESDDAGAVTTLLNHPDIDAGVRTRMRSVILMHACHTGKRRVATVLATDRRTGVNIKDKYGRTPAGIAYTRNWHQILCSLSARLGRRPRDVPDWAIAYSVNLFRRTKDPKDMLRRLPRDINARNADGYTPLMRVLRAQCDVPVGALLALAAEGADVNARTERGDSVLYMYVRDHGTLANAGVICALAAVGADVNARTSSGDTVLLYAIRHKLATCAIAIMSCRGADLNIRNARGAPAVLYAFRERRHNAIALMLALDRRVNINATDQLGETALTWSWRYWVPTAYAIIQARPDAIVDPPGRGPPYALDFVRCARYGKFHSLKPLLIKLSCFEALRNEYRANGNPRGIVAEEIRYRCRWTTRDLRRTERGEVSRRALVYCLVLISRRGFGSATWKDA